MISDKALRKLVEDEIDFEPSVDSRTIAVAVKDGIVTLTGHVATFAQKVAVEWAAKRVKGVRGLAQEVKVQTTADAVEADDEIARRVADLIDWDTTLPKNAVKVQVTEGHVLLVGEVDWAYQRLAAGRGVRNLRGVRDVVNQITVKPAVEPGDIRRRIEDALQRQAQVDATHVRVAVDGARVHLDGKVRAWFERDAIVRAAWSAPGVNAVDNHITVAPEAT